MSEQLNEIIDSLKLAIDSSLDAVAVIDHTGNVVYLNAMMKTMLGLKGKSYLRKPINLSDKIDIQTTQEGGTIRGILQQGTPARLDETPAEVVGKKARIMMSGVPLYSKVDVAKETVLGALITVRDTTDDVLLHAKFQKMIQLVRSKDQQLAEMMLKIQEHGGNMQDLDLFKY